jgi:GAF domain-containing protein
MLAQMTARLRAQQSFDAAVEVLLNDVAALHAAEFGDVQLSAGDELILVAQRNLSTPFLEAFRRVRKDDGCVCGRALRSRDSVVVSDIDTDTYFAPFRGDATAAGFRGVQSTPIFAGSGR